MIVGVDEAWRDHEAFAIDDGVTGLRLDVAYGDDAIVHEADVGASERGAAPVHEIGADDRRRPIGGAASREQRQRNREDRQNPLGRIQKLSFQVPPAGMYWRSEYVPLWARFSASVMPAIGSKQMKSRPAGA